MGSVDEIALLNNHDVAKQVISELGKVVYAYKQNTSSMCTALVTSLTTENFQTPSGRSVKVWTPPIPDESIFDHIIEDIPESAISNKESMINVLSTVGGRHMRSLVLLRQIMEKDRHFLLSTQHILDKMKGRLGVTIDQKEYIAIRSYIESCIRADKMNLPVELEPYADSVSAIAPALILMAFETSDSKAKTALFNLFDLVASSGNVYKQLENIAKSYDFFRQNLELPVVPGTANIYLPDNMNDVKAIEWYRELVFPQSMAQCEDSLLKSTGKDEAECIVKEMKLGVYFHPNQSNHPWIDRAFLAQHPKNRNEYCLVLAQDKVNKDDFPQAVSRLNMAAGELSRKCGVKDVLCIANVIGATDKTTCQNKFQYPYILIRGEKEVKHFFSISFAPIVMFTQNRHTRLGGITIFEN